MDPVLLALMVFLILGSIVALEMKNLLSAVIAVGIVGLGLSILFLLLAAPDIAITQVVVEIIVVTVLIRAAGRIGKTETGAASHVPTLVAGIGLILVLLGFLLHGISALPAFGEAKFGASTWYLLHATELTHSSNVVTAILLDFRAYDTLGEATVILTAVVGVLAVLRRPSHRTPSTPPPIEGGGAPTTPSDPSEVIHG